MQEIHVGNVGQMFVLSFYNRRGVTDISAGGAIEITLMKPDGSKVVKPGALYTDGKDGKATYVTEAGVLSAAGSWFIQAKVGTLYSDIEQFYVHPNL
jgi:hypothetical protein